MRSFNINKPLLVVLACSLAFFACTPTYQTNDNLDTTLNELVQAAKGGQAASYAQQKGIELLSDNKEIRVDIYTVSGLAVIAGNVTAKYGKVEIILPKDDAIQAVVPIANLVTLANDKSIRFITIPISPSPAQ